MDQKKESGAEGWKDEHLAQEAEDSLAEKENSKRTSDPPKGRKAKRRRLNKKLRLQSTEGRLAGQALHQPIR